MSNVGPVAASAIQDINRDCVHSSCNKTCECVCFKMYKAVPFAAFLFSGSIYEVGNARDFFFF